MSNVPQVSEASIPTGSFPGAQVRQFLVFEFDPTTGVYQQVNTEVVALADSLTGLGIRPATEDTHHDMIHLLRGILRAQVTILNELAGREASYELEDFLKDEEDEEGK